MPSSFTWRHYLLKKVCIVLGVYEFISAYNFYYNPKYSLHHIPNEFKYPTVRCIFAVYLLTLGLQRLSYGFSKDNNIMLVFTLLLTHIVEGFLWWSMALTKSSLTPVVLLLDAIQLKLGVDTFIVLIGVPLLVILMMYLSIDSFIKKKKI